MYSNKTTRDFNFSTDYQQVSPSGIEAAKFCFVKEIPSRSAAWHAGTKDHTNNDANGYMYFLDVGPIGSQIFNMTIDQLCTGIQYEFSAYFANVVQSQHISSDPNIRFQVRTASFGNHLLAQRDTGPISKHNNMAWKKYGLSFIAYSSSVVLLMISNEGAPNGNDVAIDDLELRTYFQSKTSLD